MQSTTKGWAIGIAIGFVLAVGIGSAEARKIKFKNRFAGTFLSTRIDLYPIGNPDGVVASWSTLEVKGKLGKRTNQGVSEVVPTGATAECPGGVFIIDKTDPDPQNRVGFGTSTSTFPNGDQIYSRTLTRTLCSDGAGGFTGTTTFEILGGTGKFAGAQGTAESSSAGSFLVFDPTANQGFGFFTGEGSGTLIFP